MSSGAGGGGAGDGTGNTGESVTSSVNLGNNTSQNTTNFGNTSTAMGSVNQGFSVSPAPSATATGSGGGGAGQGFGSQEGADAATSALAQALLGVHGSSPANNNGVTAASQLGLGQNGVLGGLGDAAPSGHVSVSPLGPPSLNPNVISQLNALLGQSPGSNALGLLGLLGGNTLGNPANTPASTMGFPAQSGVSPGLGGLGGSPASPGPSPSVASPNLGNSLAANSLRGMQALAPAPTQAQTSAAQLGSIMAASPALAALFGIGPTAAPNTSGANNAGTAGRGIAAPIVPANPNTGARGF